MSSESLMAPGGANAPAITVGEIADFESRVREKLRHAEELEKRAAVLREEAEADEKRIEFLKEVVSSIKGLQKPPQRSPQSRANRVKKSTWTAEVLFLVQESPEGYASYADMKAALAEGVLGPALKQSDKSFYGALLKLENQKMIVRHNAHAFTPEAYFEHISAVNAGERKDVRPKHAAGNAPLTEAVLDILQRSRKPLAGREIIDELLKIEEVKDPVERNNTSAYNVLSRLVKQKRVAKNTKDKTYWLYDEHELSEVRPVSRETGLYDGEVAASLNGSGTPKGVLL